MYAVFKFDKGAKDIDAMYKNDLISRQTIVKRDAKSLGFEGNDIYLLVEGTADAIEEARKIAGEYEIKGSDAEKIYKRIKESEEEASIGMGAIFG